MPYVGYAFILLVCLEVLLVCFDRIRPKIYPLILYGIGAGMVLMTTLAGPYLVGSDIHLEYYYAQLRAGADVMAPDVGTPQGTSIITYITDNIWAFKVIYPLIFALVPSILYLVFKTWVTNKQAFLASFFFIAFPAFSMELPEIAKQMIAEVVLVALLYILVVSKLKFKFKLPLTIICGALLPLVHYAVAIVTLILLGIGCILRGNRKLIGVGLITIILVSSIYFPLAEDGAVFRKLVSAYNSLVPKIMEVTAEEPFSPQWIGPEVREYPSEAAPPVGGMSLLNKYGALIYSGMGLDFFQTTIPSKIFRLLQWVLLCLMVVGIWNLRKNKKYWIFARGGLLLVLFLLIPGFSILLNATRFIHLALFVLAPLLVVVLKPKYTAIILIAYFLFTSGFVFEAIKQPNIEQITIPYNFGLSSYRMDLGASVTQDDTDVVRYIYKNSLYPVFADIVGTDLLEETLGWRINSLHAAIRSKPFEAHEMYVLVRSRNIQDGTFTTWNGVGCRRYADPEEYGINWNENIVYQSGDSRVIWVP